ncbi:MULTISPECIES: ABC transporter substrate-binding protein [Cohnella]|jgi:multiple sugar transport system substrate-binding protein|uniref:ABC transporter substrate-binding protein n=1 Tax=Cohnella TaxID=329857 RepID=UPI000362E7C3|nr:MULTISPECIES: ABC transporter substrate-binding protein [Cohnella]REK68483.1 MAG: ABC transporter substrate-binding protein [Cohnella sp.]
MLRKKTLAFISSTVVALSLLAGCGSNNDAANPASGSPSASSGAKPQEKVEISFWTTYSDADAGPITALVDNFNKSQDRITVKMLGNQDPTKQLTAISGGAAPDVLLTYWNNIGPWADAGAVLDLTEKIAQSGFDVNAVIPAAMERMKINGKVYAMPFTMSMASSLMYNKADFEEAGITKPPETLEELFEYAKKLTKKDADGNITQIGFIPDYPWIDNVFWPIIFGGSWIDEATGRVTPNAEANVKAIAYQRSFYEEFGQNQIDKFKSGMGKRGTPQDPLLTGQLAMYIGWEYNFMPERGEDGPIGVAPFPYPADRPDLKGSGMVSPRAVFIPAKAKHKDEAWEFIQYLMQTDTQVQYSLDAHVIPTLTAALSDDRLYVDSNKTMWPFYERAKSENLNGFPNSPYINEYLQALTEETEKALKGTLSPQEAMDNVAKKIQPLADKK